MTEITDDRPATLSRGERWALIALAIGLSVSIGIAAVLHPRAQGLGTHQQLGLPPCTVRVLFGQPCPSCGMTTSWANLVRGNVSDALRANIGGTLLGVLAMAGIPYLTISAARGRWWGFEPSAVIVTWLSAAIVSVTLIQWGLRLAAG